MYKNFETVQSQQAYMTVLSDKQIHYMDVIQLNAPDYDLDIDREPDSVNAVQPSNADSVNEDTFTGTSKPEDNTTICLTTNRSEHQSSEVLSDIQINKHNNAEQQ